MWLKHQKLVYFHGLAGVCVGEAICTVKYINNNSPIDPPQVNKIEMYQKRYELRFQPSFPRWKDSIFRQHAQYICVMYIKHISLFSLKQNLRTELIGSSGTDQRNWTMLFELLPYHTPAQRQKVAATLTDAFNIVFSDLLNNKEKRSTFSQWLMF